MHTTGMPEDQSVRRGDMQQAKLGELCEWEWEIEDVWHSEELSCEEAMEKLIDADWQSPYQAQIEGCWRITDNGGWYDFTRIACPSEVRARENKEQVQQHREDVQEAFALLRDAGIAGEYPFPQDPRRKHEIQPEFIDVCEVAWTLDFNGAARTMTTDIPLKVLEAPEAFDCGTDQQCVQDYATCFKNEGLKAKKEKKASALERLTGLEEKARSAMKSRRA